MAKMVSYFQQPNHVGKVLWYRAFLPAKCVGANVIITAGASEFLLAPAWLPHSKYGGSRQGRGAFISTLDGFLCLCCVVTKRAQAEIRLRPLLLWCLCYAFRGQKSPMLPGLWRDWIAGGILPFLPLLMRFEMRRIV